MESPSRQTFKRNIAIDAHKSYVKVGGLSPQLEVVLPLRKVLIRRFPR